MIISMPKTDPLPVAVKDILFREWDPIGVNDHPQWIDDYDRYAPNICQMLRAGADEYKLTAHLRQLASVCMGLSANKDDRHRQTAKRLIALLG
jgi:hypothetical protein